MKGRVLMKISTKGRYALRLMLDLAYNHTGSFIPIKNISQRQDISDKYLEQIITQLSRAGLVKSARGAQGGYMLAKEPQEYTVGDECVTMEVWREIKDAVNKVVDNITLADLVEQQRQKCRCCK